MTVMSWLRLTVTLWLIRKAFKAAGWLLLLALAVALWPVTIVMVAGYLAAWLRGWPPARLRRGAAASLILAAAYTADAVTGQHAARVRAAARHTADIQLRYATLLDRLGPALDGPGTLEDADAWYFILEGTREPSVAEAQALALTELAARAATNPPGEQRAILLPICLFLAMIMKQTDS